MFKILIRNLETESYQQLSCVRFKTRDEAEEAVKRMWVQVRPGGEYIRPEEYEIVEDCGKSSV